MLKFAKKLVEFSKQHSLAEIDAKDLYRKEKDKCLWRKLEEHDIEGQWYVCTHSAFDESPYIWACRLHHCPFISQGMRQAYKLSAERRKEASNG